MKQSKTKKDEKFRNSNTLALVDPSQSIDTGKQGVLVLQDL
jgi:hypothetical protein